MIKTAHSARDAEKMSRQSKYASLRRRLEQEGTLEVHLTFEEMDAIVDGGLSPSLRAGNGRSWRNAAATSSVQARAWTGAGYVVRKVTNDGVVFVRKEDAP